MGVINVYKVAIVLNKVVQNISSYKKFPEFAQPIIVVDITNYEGIVKEGYVYEMANGVFSEPNDTVEPPVIEPSPDNESIEGKLDRLEQQLEIQQQQNLILLDVNMTIYEELLVMQERLSDV